MIKGIGIDIVDIRRLDSIIKQHGERFLKKVFTEAEIGFCSGKANPAIHFAGRWAAKEAFFKALPVSCQRHSSWKSVRIIVSQDNGRPVVEICDGSLRNWISKEAISKVHVTISHEQTFCTAFVVLE